MYWPILNGTAETTRLALNCQNEHGQHDSLHVGVTGYSECHHAPRFRDTAKESKNPVFQPDFP